MDVVDNVFASASDPVGQPKPEAPKVRRRAQPRTGKPAGARGSAATPTTVEEAGRVDSSHWLELLQRAGFTRQEAARLIFERTCPRDEGLRRH
jgi:hypothetical protein